MKRLSSSEIGIFLLAIVLVGVGIWLVLHPTETVMVRDTTVPEVGGRSTSIDYVTKKEMLIGGGLSAVFGAGLIVAVFYSRTK